MHCNSVHLPCADPQLAAIRWLTFTLKLRGDKERGVVIDEDMSNIFCQHTPTCMRASSSPRLVTNNWTQPMWLSCMSEPSD
jgi:hypothetical protein